METHIQSFHTMNLYGIFLTYKLNLDSKKEKQLSLESYSYLNAFFKLEVIRLLIRRKSLQRNWGLEEELSHPICQGLVLQHTLMFLSNFYYKHKCKRLMFKVLSFPIAQRNLCGWSPYHQQNFNVVKAVSNLSFKK